MSDHLCWKNFEEACGRIEGCVFSHIDHVDASIRRINSMPRGGVMVTMCGDWPVDSQWRWAITDGLKAWFAINIAWDHDVLRPIPIGVPSDPTYGNFDVIQRHMNTPKTKNVFSCFAIGNNIHERVSAVESVSNLDGVTSFLFPSNEQKLLPHEEFIRKMSEHRFVLSPPGNLNSDCHRTWEALYLGCIPICKRTGSTRFFTDLPILFVDNWSDINQKMLNQAECDLGPKWENARAILRMPYWENMIRSACEDLRTTPRVRTEG